MTRRGRGDARRGERRTPTRRVDLVLWHWLDTRLQSQQEVQEARDRAFSYLAMYRVDSRRSSSGSPTRKSADGDRGARSSGGPSARTTASTSCMGNLDGRASRTSTSIDMKTGQRSSRSRRAALGQRRVAGRHQVFLYYENGTSTSTRLETGTARNITHGRAGLLRRHRRRPQRREAADAGRSAGRRTTRTCCCRTAGTSGRCRSTAAAGGQPDGQRQEGPDSLPAPLALEPRRTSAASTCPSRSIFAAYGEWTKKSGIGVLEPGKTGVKMLRCGETPSFGASAKAEKADVFLYTRADADRARRLLRDRRVASRAASRLTDAASAGRRRYRWSAARS